MPVKIWVILACTPSVPRKMAHSLGDTGFYVILCMLGGENKVIIPPSDDPFLGRHMRDFMQFYFVCQVKRVK